MEPNQNRITFLDNIRNILVYNVALYHIFLMFAYPLTFWAAVSDKQGSARFYETGFMAMNIYMMPCLIFIAALFIFPSLNKGSALEYIKKRFLRLYVPVIVFLFCVSDVFFQLLSTRLNSVSPVYLDTFLSFWRSFIDMPAIYLTRPADGMKTNFNFLLSWFLTLLFFVTLVVVLLSLLFKRKNSEERKVDSRKKIILKTIIFAVIFSIVYTAVRLLYARYGINPTSWIIIGKAVQFLNYQIWELIPLFLFGLYVYKKEWLTRGDIGSWKMWGALACIVLALYVLLTHIILMPVIEEMFKVFEHNLLFDDQMAVPAVVPSFQLATLCAWFLSPLVCVFLMMFCLSFAKRFFNKPNAITAFCSKHSINVYILHYILVLILQYTFLDAPITPIVKIILITIIIIPACLWLSHRLVYPYPKIAIAFFVALKLVALAAGFTFYYWALLALIFISFAGAVYESARYLIARKTRLNPTT